MLEPESRAGPASILSSDHARRLGKHGATPFLVVAATLVAAAATTKLFLREIHHFVFESYVAKNQRCEAVGIESQLTTSRARVTP